MSISQSAYYYKCLNQTSKQIMYHFILQVRFNMKDYNPEEVNVKMDSSKIMVSARHEEKSGGSTVSREYSREVNIPRDVDPLALQCTLNPDGYLVVHAPLPVPGYPSVKDAGAPTRPENSSTVVSSSSSYYSSPSGGLNKMSSFQTSSSSSTTSSGGRPQLQPQSSLPAYFQHQQPQQHLHHQQQQQQQQQVKTHVLNQQHTSPPSSTQHNSNNVSMHSNSINSLNSNSSNSSAKHANTSFPSSRAESIHEEVLGHPDHVVPAYKPPPDLSKLDLLDSASTSNSSHQMRSSPIPPALRQAQPPPAPSPTPSSSSASHHQQQQQHSASPAASTFHNPSAFPAPPPFSSSPLVPPPAFSAPPPFSALNASFPTGPLFPDSTTQVNQLSTPQVTSHDGKFQLTMPIEDFKPEELTVKTQDGKVVICASRKVKDGNRSQSSEMSREHSLPNNVDPLTVKAFFTDTGNLIVEAPFIRS